MLQSGSEWLKQYFGLKLKIQNIIFISIIIILFTIDSDWFFNLFLLLHSIIIFDFYVQCNAISVSSAA